MFIFMLVVGGSGYTADQLCDVAIEGVPTEPCGARSSVHVADLVNLRVHVCRALMTERSHPAVAGPMSWSTGAAQPAAMAR